MFLHLPRRTFDLHLHEICPYPSKKAGTSEQACKSLILNRKTCSVSRTVTELPEQKTKLSTGNASFKQTVNDRTLFSYLCWARTLNSEASADPSSTVCVNDAHAVVHARALE